MNLNLSAAAPEIVLLCALFAVLLADLWTSDENRYITHYLSIGSMLAAAFTQIAVWTEQPAQAFNGFYLVDGVSQLAKLTVYLGTAALFVYAKPYNQHNIQIRVPMGTLIILHKLLNLNISLSITI